jgi:hypothetical protein
MKRNDDSFILQPRMKARVRSGGVGRLCVKEHEWITANPIGYQRQNATEAVPVSSDVGRSNFSNFPLFLRNRTTGSLNSYH